MSKCCYILFKPISKYVDQPYPLLELRINDTVIKQVKSTKFLGVIIDEKLSWVQHIAAVKMKMSRYIGLMYKLKKHLPLDARLQIYHSFVQSHLNYCSLIWGFAAKTHIDSLFVKQKMGIRAVLPGFVNLCCLHFPCCYHWQRVRFLCKSSSCFVVLLEGRLWWQHLWSASTWPRWG